MCRGKFGEVYPSCIPEGLEWVVGSSCKTVETGFGPFLQISFGGTATPHL